MVVNRSNMVRGARVIVVPMWFQCLERRVVVVVVVVALPFKIRTNVSGSIINMGLPGL